MHLPGKFKPGCLEERGDEVGSSNRLRTDFAGRELFRHAHDEAVAEMEISYLSANLSGIYFHDSIVVFDKSSRVLPKSELR